MGQSDSYKPPEKKTFSNWAYYDYSCNGQFPFNNPVLNEDSANISANIL